MGPTFRYTTTLAANGVVRPFQDDAWIYRRAPFACRVFVGLVADGVGAKFMFSAGSDVQAGPDQPVAAGGTVGVFMDDITKMDEYLASAGDELQLVIRETAGVATTDVMLAVRLQPL